MKNTLIFLFTLQTLIASAQTDTTNGFTAPANVSNNVQELADYLCESLSSDKDKANIIFNWVTHNISFDIKAAKDPERTPKSAQDVLKNKKGAADEYAELYKELCLAAGLEAVTVHGYIKQWYYDRGDSLYMPLYGWCAVSIDRRWELVDPAAGAGHVTYTPGWLRKQLNRFSKEKVLFSKTGEFEFNYSPEYFMIDPLIARFKRVPADPIWQLTEEPMPMSVFLSGDSLIMNYNQSHYYRVDNRPAMQRQVSLSNEDNIVDNADRIYGYNNLYELILGAKGHIEAGRMAVNYLKEGNITVAESTAEQVKDKIKEARKHYEQQQSYLTPQYNKLKRKNATKNRDANARFRELRLENKMLTSKYNSHISKAERKRDAVDAKKESAEAQSKDIDQGRINEIETITVEKEPGDELLDAVGDSIDAKQDRLAVTWLFIEDEVKAIDEIKAANEKLLQRLAVINYQIDTVYALEANARLRMQDGNDDKVKHLISVHQEWGSPLEQVHSNYLENFDSIVDRSERLYMTYLQQMRLYKGVLRHLEQYQRWFSKEPNVKPEYVSMSKDYHECIDKYKGAMEMYKEYLHQNIERFNKVVTSFEERDNLVEYMEQGEKTRKEMEDKEIDEDNAYVKRSIEIRLNSLDELEKNVEETMTGLRNADKKMRDDERKREEEERRKKKEEEEKLKKEQAKSKKK
ncbi:MAG: hypothetical protein H6551_11955 [Chitinophagales bacterium]|nr:hypothetical protein [Chitinophagaceae bacterium]MCB9065843.1 hypothetical protein [Chitinophagales bacterium]